jgi:hypothetical protein
METDRGKTRGKFTELVFDVKHDAWVIPQYSHGILLIVDAEENTGVPALKVDLVNDEVLSVNFTGASASAIELDTSDNETHQLTWDIDGTGNFNQAVTFSLAGTSVSDALTVSSTGLLSTAAKTGTVADGVVTITATGNTALTDTVAVTVVA